MTEELSETSKGVVYLGHIPYGFFEKEIKEYFSQFGIVNKVRLSRSKDTGRSKGYGFIEFDDEDVAKIAADTMNNYLMFDKILKCEFRPANTLHPKMFKGASRHFRPNVLKPKIREKHNQNRSDDNIKRNIGKCIKKINKKKMLLKDMGINYDFELDIPDNLAIKDKDRKNTKKVPNTPLNSTLKKIKIAKQKKNITKTVKSS